MTCSRKLRCFLLLPILSNALVMTFVSTGLARAQVAAIGSPEALGLLERGRTLQSADLLSQAKTFFTDCVHKRPSDSACSYSLSRVCLYLADVLRGSGRKDEARRVLDEGIQVLRKTLAQKETAESHCLLADLYGQYIALHGGFAGAIYGSKVAAENKRALELDPNDARVYASLGREYYFAPSLFGGDLKKAIDAFRRSLAINPNSDETLVWLALAYKKAGDREAFESGIKKALQINPQSVFARQAHIR